MVIRKVIITSFKNIFFMVKALISTYRCKERTVKPMNLFYSQCTANKIKGLFLALFFMKLFDYCEINTLLPIFGLSLWFYRYSPTKSQTDTSSRLSWMKYRFPSACKTQPLTPSMSKLLLFSL